MGDIVRRGTRDNPKYYVRYVDVDGTRRMKLAKGVYPVMPRHPDTSIAG